jgi:hypothetical protein
LIGAPPLVTEKVLVSAAVGEGVVADGQEAGELAGLSEGLLGHLDGEALVRGEEHRLDGQGRRGLFVGALERDGDVVGVDLIEPSLGLGVGLDREGLGEPVFAGRHVAEPAGGLRPEQPVLVREHLAGLLQGEELLKAALHAGPDVLLGLLLHVFGEPTVLGLLHLTGVGERSSRTETRRR